MALDQVLSSAAGPVAAAVTCWLLLTLVAAGCLRLSQRRARARTGSVLDTALRVLAPGIAGRVLRGAVGLGATGTAVFAGSLLPAANALAATPQPAPTAHAVHAVRATPLTSRTAVPDQSPIPQPPDVRPPDPRSVDLWPLSASAGHRQPRVAEPGEVVVHRGDTLWAIAARHLPEGASDARIDATWRLWFEANRAVIGGNPNHLLPGQVLHAPR